MTFTAFYQDIPALSIWWLSPFLIPVLESPGRDRIRTGLPGTIPPGKHKPRTVSMSWRFQVGMGSFPRHSDQFWSIQFMPLVHWGGVRLTLGA